MMSYLKRVTTKKIALPILGSVIFFALLKPCPGDYCQLGDVEPKVRAVTTFIFWCLFTGFQIKRRFFGEDQPASKTKRSARLVSRIFVFRHLCSPFFAGPLICI
ncbi:hypothetical protein [Larkinella punicea]|uniref:hypothetical protein n=1 Tax=Larkinella punicea TaxID=2315727 RepID=UPI001058F829|nr:hypothetical protein [Larkinella punicea]